MSKPATDSDDGAHQATNDLAVAAALANRMYRCNAQQRGLIPQLRKAALSMVLTLGCAFSCSEVTRAEDYPAWSILPGNRIVVDLRGVKLALPLDPEKAKNIFFFADHPNRSDLSHIGGLYLPDVLTHRAEFEDWLQQAGDWMLVRNYGIGRGRTDLSDPYLNSFGATVWFVNYFDKCDNITSGYRYKYKNITEFESFDASWAFLSCAKDVTFSYILYKPPFDESLLPAAQSAIAQFLPTFLLNRTLKVLP